MEIPIQKMPETIEEFLEVRDSIANTPEGGAAVYVIAMYLYCQKKELGLAALTIASHQSRLSNGNHYKGYAVIKSDLTMIESQLQRNPHLPASYFVGTSPENGYQLPSNLVLDITENPYSGDRTNGPFKVFVRSTGADSPRPMTLQANEKGIWKTLEASSVIVGVRAPKQNISDDL